MKLLFNGIPLLISYHGRHNAQIVEDKILYNIRYIIIDQGTHPTAYIGVDFNHKLAGNHYDHINLNVHGGLTFSNPGGGLLPSDFFWYGWDYAHIGDYYATPDSRLTFMGDKKWKYYEILEHIIEAIKEFNRL